MMFFIVVQATRALSVVQIAPGIFAEEEEKKKKMNVVGGGSRAFIT